MPPQGPTPVQIPVRAPDGGLPPVIQPQVIEIDDQQDSFFGPRAASVYDAFGPPADEVEKKVRAIRENLKALESSNDLGLDSAKMCLVPDIVIPAKFKVHDFEKYKGANDTRTHIRDYYRKMAAYSDDDIILIHFF